ncbi:MAG: serine--tRNA ligase [Deltaproteobacteria bacterium]|nr:serine--tRNA ligase [Deltaproteobacteria bacterium]
MLDIRLLRDDPDRVRREIAKLHVEAPLEEAIRLDARRRQLVSEGDGLKQQMNDLSRAVGRAQDAAKRQALIAAASTVKERLPAVDEELKQIDEQLRQVMLAIPNLPHESVPDGKDESENRVVRQSGEPRAFAFAPQPHWELGARLGIIDFERGAKISGSRFYVLLGAGARLQRALISFMLDLHTREHGYTEVYPPYMVKGECMVGTGQLPRFGDNLYRDAEEDYWFVPTAEVPVTNLYRDEVLPAERLPINHVAYTACFRREKMSAGRDVRGIKRGHQFDKVELVKFVRPETSMAELERLMSDAEDVLRRLEIPYRVIQMCTGDLSFTAAVKYDLEAWAGGCKEWLEVSSCSNFMDFQARRAGIRFKETGGKARFVHTLNGSGLALPRVLIAVLENYQQADGTIAVPPALRPYLGGDEVIR